MVPASKQSEAASSSASAPNHGITLSGIDALAKEAEQEALERSIQSQKRKHGDDDDDGEVRPLKQSIRDADEIDI